MDAKAMRLTASHVAVVVVLSGLSLLVQQCSPKCEVEVVAETIAPDNTRVATVFVENCHATAPFVTAVNIRRLTCELDSDNYVFAIEGRGLVKIMWEKSDSLAIHYQSDARVYRSELRLEDVAITYSIEAVAAESGR